MKKSFFYLDDSEDILGEICMGCRHLKTFRQCSAFEEIPLEIWNADNPHSKPYPGDGGIQFESK